MKKILIIDGYNAIQKIRRFADELDESLEAARQAFVKGLSDYRARNRAFGEIIVVFDGAGNKDSGPKKYRNGFVEVMFSSSGESADDLIKALLAENISCDITVVSDDNYVANNCRAHKAAIMHCREFEGLIAVKPFKAKFGGFKEKEIDPETASDINEQLKKVWRL